MCGCGGIDSNHTADFGDGAPENCGEQPPAIRIPLCQDGAGKDLPEEKAVFSDDEIYGKTGFS